jgi:hypothetical protein
MEISQCAVFAKRQFSGVGVGEELPVVEPVGEMVVDAERVRESDADKEREVDSVAELDSVVEGVKEDVYDPASDLVLDGVTVNFCEAVVEKETVADGESLMLCVVETDRMLVAEREEDSVSEDDGVGVALPLCEEDRVHVDD